MFNYLSNKIESNIQLTFIMLLFFHALVSIFLFLLASSEYFSNLHNGEGLWNFARDSWLYHKEAISSVHLLQNSEWATWWSAELLHMHVRFISFIYWITGYETPIAFEVVNGLVWTTSVMLIYRSSKVLFENNTVVPILTVLFFLQPSVLISSTQLLKDPFVLLGLCFMCYGWILIAKTKLHRRAVLYLAIGSLLYISTRPYLGLIILVVCSSYAVYLLLTNKITLVNAAIIVFSILFVIHINSNIGRSSTHFLSTQIDGNFIQTEALAQTNPNTKLSISEEVKDLVIKTNNKLTAAERAEFIEYMSIIVEKIDKKYSEPILGKLMRTLRLLEIKSIEDNLAVIKNFESNFDQVLEELSENNKKLQSLYKRVQNSKELLLSRHNQLLIYEEEWMAKNAVFKFLDATVWRLTEMRSGFRNVNKIASSKVDPILQFEGFVDGIAYLPRALQISFLSPFPINWIEEGKETGHIGRLLSGLEMLVWYVVIIGFIYEMITASFRIRPLIPVLIFSTIVIILLGYAVPNMGAIYRMRQDQIIPFYLIGIYGVYSITNRLNNKRSVDS